MLAARADQLPSSPSPPVVGDGVTGFDLLLHRNPVQIRLARLSFVVSRVARPVLEPGAQHHRTPVVGTEHFLLWATSAVLQISVNEANYPARCTQRHGAGCPGYDED